MLYGIVGHYKGVLLTKVNRKSEKNKKDLERKNEHDKEAAAIRAHLINGNPRAGYVFKSTDSKVFK